MGSHGGATVDGQRHVLAEYGITEDTVGAPIRATMDTVALGTLPSGAVVHFDANAAGANATIVVNRVKAHTAFRGEIESGLCKMTAIGLGKAARCRASLTLPRPARPHPAGRNAVAQTEQRRGRPGPGRKRHPRAGACPRHAAGRFVDTDRELLRSANAYLPRVPFEHLHLLVVG